MAAALHKNLSVWKMATAVFLTLLLSVLFVSSSQVPNNKLQQQQQQQRARINPLIHKRTINLRKILTNIIPRRRPNPGQRLRKKKKTQNSSGYGVPKAPPITEPSKRYKDKQKKNKTPAPAPAAAPAAGDSYGAPKAPVVDSYGAPKAPTVDSYGAPKAPTVDSYGAPKAPVVDSYGAPEAPAVDSYGAPKAPVKSKYKPPPSPPAPPAAKPSKPSTDTYGVPKAPVIKKPSNEFLATTQSPSSSNNGFYSDPPSDSPFQLQSFNLGQSNLILLNGPPKSTSSDEHLPIPVSLAHAVKSIVNQGHRGPPPSPPRVQHGGFKPLPDKKEPTYRPFFRPQTTTLSPIRPTTITNYVPRPSSTTHDGPSLFNNDPTFGPLDGSTIKNNINEISTTSSGNANDFGGNAGDGEHQGN